MVAAPGGYGGAPSSIPAYQYDQPDDGGYGEGRKSKWWLWAIGIVVVLGAIGGGAYLLLAGGSKTYAVPQVQGLSQSKAETKVKQAHLKPVTVMRASATTASGHV